MQSAVAAFRTCRLFVPHPLGLAPYGKGFLTFTTNGIMLFELSSDPTAAFTHRAFTFRNTALNPFCILPFEDNDKNEVIWLGKNGSQHYCWWCDQEVET